MESSANELLGMGRSAGFDAEDGGAIEELLNGDDVALLFDGIEISLAVAGTNIDADIGLTVEIEVGELSRPFGDSSDDRLRFMTMLIGRFFGGRARFLVICCSSAT